MDPQPQAHPAVNGTSQVAGINPDQRPDAEDSQSIQHPTIGRDRSVDPRSRTSEDEWTPDSHNNHQTNVTDEDAVTAADMPLPESIQTSSRQCVSDTPETVGNQAEASYWRNVQKWQDRKLLVNVELQSRAHNRASFELWDYNNGNLIKTKTYHLGSTASRAAEDFTAAIVNDVPANTDTRLLVVDDLSSNLIHVLHTCLGVSLEFFEEYLLNAGWHSNEYHDIAPQMWNIKSDFVKDYVTVKWFRPLRAGKYQSSGERDLRVELDPSRIPEKWEEKTSDRSRISHSTQPLVNILRRPWEAKLRPRAAYSAWEERASVWSSQLGKCRIVVLLLDPMPAISHTIANAEVEQYPQGLPEVQSRHRENIQRSSEELEDQDPENRRNRIKISIPGVSWFAQLFLRVFKFDTLGRMSEEAIPSTESRHGSGSHRSAQRSVREDAQLANTYREYCMFIACSVRGPYSDTMISDKKQRFARGLQSYSTTNMLKQLLQPYDVLVPDRSTPLEGLIQFIVHDTFKILQFIDMELTRMNLEMLDDMRVQEHIDDWRRELHRFDSELRTMESSIPEFADFVLETQRRDSHTTAAKGSRAIHELLGRFEKRVTQVQRQTKSTHRSLMAALSLIENKRGISEAESVTKLTELAFFFHSAHFCSNLVQHASQRA
ncbi:MAG: hypothetical protein L6R36_007165 [Xanthoria steineri]|nr:MAG: hypothetical protein L6R36_007165 [Xanthoria steineri]